MTIETDSLYSSLGEAEAHAKDLEGKLRESQREISEFRIWTYRLADALENLLTNHCRLVDSGDCGDGDSGAEVEVIAARALLDELPDRPVLNPPSEAAT